VADGTVLQSSYSDENGNFIAIKHSDNSQSWYLHLSHKNAFNRQHVKGRQLIGKVGNTGKSSGPHLHFAIRQPNGSWMNPLMKRMIATPKLDGARLLALANQVKDIRKILAETEAAEPKSIGDSLQATIKWIEL
jgi:murein DD-endopeptidase MepM/ murein hydrolase activator NlpD